MIQATTIGQIFSLTEDGKTPIIVLEIMASGITYDRADGSEVCAHIEHGKYYRVCYKELPKIEKHQKIVNGNKLISAFMGEVSCDYHRSWMLLMPVLYKMVSINIFNIAELKYFKHEISLNIFNGEYIIWTIVIKYIEKYNLTQKT